MTTLLKAGRPSADQKAKTLASLADKPDMTRVNFELSCELHVKLKVYAARQRKTVRELLTEYIEQLPG